MSFTLTQWHVAVLRLYAQRLGVEVSKSAAIRRLIEAAGVEFTEEEIAAMLEAIERENAAS